MNSYKITFYMATPIVVNFAQPLHFDGLLGWAKSALDGKKEKLPQFFEELDLPLEMAGTHKRFYKASAWEIPEAFAGQDYWARTPAWPDNNFIRVGGYNLIGQGPFRAFQGKLQLICAPKVIFYFTGDIDKVKTILRPFRKRFALGAYTRVGYGRTINYRIEPSPDYSIWDANGQPARFIPVDEAEKIPPGAVYDIAPYRPPYWYGGVKCLIPPPSRWLPKEE